MAKEIQLTKGKTVIIDDEDYDKLNKYKWYAVKGANCFYAKRTYQLNGKKTMISMHHDIIGFPGAGLETDHIDRDGLNNQKNNLRQVSTSVNHINAKKHYTNRSGYKNIYFEITKNRWRVYTSRDCKRIHHGYFKTLNEAIIARDNSVLDLTGD